jgi:hypothetical protein
LQAESAGETHRGGLINATLPRASMASEKIRRRDASDD